MRTLIATLLLFASSANAAPTTAEVNEARTEAEKAVAADPKDAAALFKLGVMEFETGRLEEAIKYFERAVDLEPDEPAIHLNLAQASQNLGRHEMALKHFGEVLRLEPENGKMVAKQIQCYRALGKAKEAAAARDDLLARHQAATYKDSRYCCEQFAIGPTKVMAFEFFEPKKPNNVSLQFYVLRLEEKDGDEHARYEIESLDSDTELAKQLGEIKDDERVYTLDGYPRPGVHQTFAYFQEKSVPAYDKVKAIVIQIVEGKRKPVSSTTANEAATKRAK